MQINHKNNYYKKHQSEKDAMLQEAIKKAHTKHPAYGYRRIALELGINHKRAQRAMQLYTIRPPRRRKKRVLTKAKQQHSYSNELKDREVALPHEVWCSDVSYIKYAGTFFYLITVEDIMSRQILAATLARSHTSKSILEVVKEAVTKVGRAPEIFHSDQGKEFLSQDCIKFWEKQRTKLSVSDKGSPWQNGYQESFFSRFKEEFGAVDRFETEGELLEALYKHIHYYNNERIHSSLKTAPAKFYATFLRKRS